MNIEYPEGVTSLDPDELEGIKFKHVTTRQQLDHLEQGNIQTGLVWLKRYKGKEILTENFIRKLHTKLFGDVWLWAGKFRTTEKNIGVDPIHISAELRKLLDDTRYWIDNNSYSHLEIVVRLHHRMVLTHLFPNGNGRHARIIADAVLTKIYELEPINWSGGYDLQNMNDRRNQYLKALRSADIGNFELLMIFIAQ